MSTTPPELSHLAEDLSLMLVASDSDEAFLLFLVLVASGVLRQPQPTLDEGSVLHAEIERLADAFLLLLSKGPAAEVIALFALLTASRVGDHNNTAREMLVRLLPGGSKWK